MGRQRLGGGVDAVVLEVEGEPAPARLLDEQVLDVLVAEGVGTGIIVDGQIYRGERGAAGEFGHMIIGTNAGTGVSGML